MITAHILNLSITVKTHLFIWYFSVILTASQTTTSTTQFRYLDYHTDTIIPAGLYSFGYNMVNGGYPVTNLRWRCTASRGIFPFFLTERSAASEWPREFKLLEVNFSLRKKLTSNIVNY